MNREEDIGASRCGLDGRKNLAHPKVYAAWAKVSCCSGILICMQKGGEIANVDVA